MPDNMTFLDSFFLMASAKPVEAETGTYILHMVGLSYIVAALGAFTGLRLLSAIHTAALEKHKDILHIGGAIALGVGIWSMHFIGMLAYRMDMLVEYDPWLTFLSMLLAAFIAFVVFSIIRHSPMTHMRLLSSALLLGLAICGMHYTGMAAMQFDGDLYYLPGLFFLSYVIAATAAAVALLIMGWLYRQNSPDKLRWEICAALILGAGVCGMHYTGMAAAVFLPWADCRYDPEQTNGMLAVAVAISSAIIFAFATTLSQIGRTSPDGNFDETAYAGQRVFLQLSTLLAVFMVLGIGSFVFIYESDKEQKKIAPLLHAASLQRMLIADYASDIAIIASLRSEDKDKSLSHGVNQAHLLTTPQEHAQNTAGIIDGNFNAMLNGGSLVLSVNKKQSQIFTAITDPTIASKIETAQADWIKLKTFAAALQQPLSPISAKPIAEMLSNLGQRKDQAIMSEDAAVITIDQAMKKRQEKLVFRQKTVLALCTLTFLLSIVYARKYIATPIEASRRALQEHQKNLKKIIRQKTADIALARDLIKRDHALQSAILDNMLQAVVIIDRNGIIKSFNKEACRIFGYDEDEAIGQNVNILMPEPYHSEHDSYLQNYNETGKKKIIGKERTNVEGRHKNGEVFPMSLSVTEVVNDDETVYVGLASDITAKKKHEEELLAAKEAAEHASSAKSAFLANMSHELRTPLNSIIGMSRLLCDDEDMTPDNINTAQIVHRSASSLLDIVNDILDLSKVEANKIKLENIAFSPQEIFSDIVDEMALPANEKGLLLTHNAQLNGVEYLKGDPLRLRRIVVNLLSNAVKYTEKGYVKLEYSLSFTGKQRKKVLLQCSVSDTGIGIAADKLDMIFDAFAQEDASITRRFGGTGLGLSITRELVELMGGSITVDSQQGKGSTFSFSIPFKIAQHRSKAMDRRNTLQPATNKQKNRKPIEQARILLAEDHLMNQAFMRKLFKKWQNDNYDIVESGDAAFNAWQETNYDVILMDCHMPGMSGYEATEKIRATENKKPNNKQSNEENSTTEPHIPIIAMTADAMLGTREKCINAGMDFYVTKPVDIDELQNVLSEFFKFPDHQPDHQQDDDTASSTFNLETLEKYAGNIDTRNELIHLFLSESQKSITILENNQTDGTNMDWVEAAHKLKGGAAMLGAHDLRDLCAELQEMEKATRKERQDAFSRLIPMYQSVCDALKRAIDS